MANAARKDSSTLIGMLTVSEARTNGSLKGPVGLLGFDLVMAIAYITKITLGPTQMADIKTIKDTAAAELREALENAYQAGMSAGRAIGYSEGQTAMRDAIISAASAPLNGGAIKAEVGDISVVITKPKVKRAPRGAVRPAVQLVLEEMPGLGSAAVAAKIAEMDSQISPHSVSNELNRNRGKRYWQARGGGWYLSQEAAEAGENRDLVEIIMRPN